MPIKHKTKNLFRYAKEELTFKLVKKVTDLSGNPYILKFRLSNDEVFFLMHSEFKRHINKGKIVFAD